MKKCIITLKDMQNVSTHERYNQMKIPVRLIASTAPASGVVCNMSDFDDFKFQYRMQQIEATHWCMDSNLVGVTNKLALRSIQSMDYRYMNTNKAGLKLPRELKYLQSA